MCEQLAANGKNKDVRSGTQTITVSTTYESQCQLDLDRGGGTVRGIRQRQLEAVHRLGVDSRRGAMELVGSSLPQSWKEGREYFVGTSGGEAKGDGEDAAADAHGSSSDEHAAFVPILTGLAEWVPEWVGKLWNTGWLLPGGSLLEAGQTTNAWPPQPASFRRGELVVVSFCSWRDINATPHAAAPLCMLTMLARMCVGMLRACFC